MLGGGGGISSPGTSILGGGVTNEKLKMALFKICVNNAE